MLNIEKFKSHIGVLLLKYYLGRNSSPFSENTIKIIMLPLKFFLISNEQPLLQKRKLISAFLAC